MELFVGTSKRRPSGKRRKLSLHLTPPQNTTTQPPIVTERTLRLPTPTVAMVLQDLGRRINAAVSDLTRSPNLDEKVCLHLGMSTIHLGLTVLGI